MFMKQVTYKRKLQFTRKLKKTNKSKNKKHNKLHNGQGLFWSFSIYL